jgi:hypothetical protein
MYCRRRRGVHEQEERAMGSVEQLRQDGWGESVVTFADSLDADGYDLELQRQGDGRVLAQINARPDACAECLVPKDVASRIMAKACGVEVGSLELRYPGEAVQA